MPSPFPGMDPYLEGSLWMSVHTPLAVEIARQLNRRLSARYIALTTRRLVMDSSEESEVVIGEVYPDVAVARSGRPTGVPVSPDRSRLPYAWQRLSAPRYHTLRSRSAMLNTGSL